MSYGLIHTIFMFFVAISILVAIHEYGHFIVARLCGVKVLRFSIGFGQRLFCWTDKKGTEFAFSAIPLGGYVKMLDDSEGDVPDDLRHLSFTHKKPWQKILIAFAGPLANFILAIVLFWSHALFVGDAQRIPIIGEVESGSIAEKMGLERGQKIVAIDAEPIQSANDALYHLISRLGESGELTITTQYPQSDLRYQSSIELENWLKGESAPDVFGGLGLSFQSLKPLLGEITDSGPADRAGLQKGDLVLAVDGTPVYSWRAWVEYVQSRAGEQIDVLVKRDEQEVLLSVTPEAQTLESGQQVGKVGVALDYRWDDYFIRQEYGVLSGLVKGLSSTWDHTDLIFVSIKKLLLGEMSIKSLSGPPGIAKVAGDSAKAGFWVFITFLAMISVSLGVLNLLPIPILDGGHIIYALIEWVKGSPVSKQVQLVSYQVGLVMVGCLMIVVIYNDVMKLVSPIQ